MEKWDYILAPNNDLPSRHLLHHQLVFARMQKLVLYFAPDNDLPSCHLLHHQLVFAQMQKLVLYFDPDNDLPSCHLLLQDQLVFAWVQRILVRMCTLVIPWCAASAVVVFKALSGRQLIPSILVRRLCVCARWPSPGVLPVKGWSSRRSVAASSSPASWCGTCVCAPLAHACSSIHAHVFVHVFACVACAATHKMWAACMHPGV